MGSKEFNKDECEKALKLIEGDIEKIIKYFKGDKLMDDDSEKKVQELFKKIMDHLQIEYQRCSAKKDKMSKVESKIYFPFLKDIFSRLLMDPESTPDSMWVVYLDDAQNNIRYYLEKLEDMV